MKIRPYLFVLACTLLVSTCCSADSYAWSQANQMDGKHLSSGVTLETGTNEFDVFVINLLAGIYSGFQNVPAIGVGYATVGNSFRPDITGMVSQPVTFHIYAAGMSSTEIMNSLTGAVSFLSAVTATTVSLLSE